ncbi:MAG: glycosyltransferase family 2 protein [Parcubacteria group bacterium]|jgi:biofilm PGA synthesis N-glycosyltransferase PgaC
MRLSRLLDWRWWFGLRPKFAIEPPVAKYSITIVVPAYNEEDSIGATISNLKLQTVPIEEIIVVDDCSSDGTGEISREMGVTVIRTHKNQGSKAMAQNYVIPQIVSDLIVTIDADTILAPDAIEKTLPWFNSPKTASVCGFVIPQKVETLWERGRFIEYVFGISLHKRAQQNIGLVMVSSGCFSVFRTELLKMMGGFDARTMAEDMDLTWNFLLEGYEIYCEQTAYCYPFDPPTLKIFVNQIDRWYRSFFQNVSVHSFRKNKGLGIMIYGYLLEPALAPILAVAFLTTMKWNFWWLIMLAAAIDLTIVAIPCLIKGAVTGMTGKVLTSLPAYWVIRFVNIYVFWRSFWREWIIKDKLNSWNKGH